MSPLAILAARHGPNNKLFRGRPLLDFLYFTRDIERKGTSDLSMVSRVVRRSAHLYQGTSFSIIAAANTYHYSVYTHAVWRVRLATC